MTKTDIIDRIASGTGLTRIETEAVVNGFIATVIQALRDEDDVELRGFGAFSVRNRPPRQGRNPRTGEPVSVKEKHVPFFKTGKELRERVDGKA